MGEGIKLSETKICCFAVPVRLIYPHAITPSGDGVFLSTKQREVLEAQGKNAIRKKVASNDLGMNSSTFHSINSNIFKNFREALEVMDEYYPVFEGRFKRHDLEVWDRMRSLRAKMQRTRNES